MVWIRILPEDEEIQVTEVSRELSINTQRKIVLKFLLLYLHPTTFDNPTDIQRRHTNIVKEALRRASEDIKTNNRVGRGRGPNNSAGRQPDDDSSPVDDADHNDAHSHRSNGTPSDNSGRSREIRNENDRSITGEEQGTPPASDEEPEGDEHHGGKESEREEQESIYESSQEHTLPGEANGADGTKVNSSKKAPHLSATKNQDETNDRVIPNCPESSLYLEGPKASQVLILMSDHEPSQEQPLIREYLRDIGTDANEIRHAARDEELPQAQQRSGDEPPQGQPRLAVPDVPPSNPNDPIPAPPRNQNLESEIRQITSQQLLRLGVNADETHLQGTIREIVQLEQIRRDPTNEKVDGWWKTRWAIVALHCHYYWEEIKEILGRAERKTANERTPDKRYIWDMVDQSKHHRATRGMDSANHLKLAVFPYLGLNPGDDNHWTYQIKVGKAASVFEKHWGLLALTKPSMLHKLGYSILQAAIPIVIRRHPSLSMMCQVLEKSYIDPLYGEGRLNRDMLGRFLDVAKNSASLTNACRPHGLASIFGFVIEGQEFAAPNPTANLPDADHQLQTPPRQQARLGALPTPPHTRSARPFSGSGDDSEGEYTSSPLFDEPRPPSSSTPRYLLRRPHGNTSDSSPQRRVRRRTGE
ncbi:MAG: hypothetical protein Q9220_007796 [cf. Caloplaca sp. 1 TL-2023]